MTDHTFQVDLHGIVDLLSNHLYSGPKVYVRELLQNAVDAITARQLVEPDHRGAVTIEVVGDDPPTLVVDDDGIGLTFDEVETFLATIGRSSKRDELSFARREFIGQFGIGLLSCFVVSEEIVVITKSVVDGNPAIEWRGSADGTYSVRVLDTEHRPGTTVYLRARRGSEEWFGVDRVTELAMHYGEMLPCTVAVRAGEAEQVVTRPRLPWDHDAATYDEHLDEGQQLFGVPLLDFFPISAPVGGVEGIAYVLALSPGPSSRSRHRVYLKRMLLSDACDTILPDWAFFVTCVLNADDLEPTASREDLQDGDGLRLTRDALGDAVRARVLHLAEHEPDRLRQWIGFHQLSMKALAAHDDEFLGVIADWLPFETTMGRVTLREFRSQHPVVRFARTTDAFRQVAQVASAQGIGVVNGGYEYDADVLQRAAYVLPELEVREVEPDDLVAGFTVLSAEDEERSAALLERARSVLDVFDCDVTARRFEPWSIPTLYTASDDARFRRTIDQSRSVANPLFGSILDSVGEEYAERPRLCLNFENPLISKLVTLDDNELLDRSIELLYLQALLLGHHPLRGTELAALNSSLLGLIEWGADAKGDAR